MQQNLDIFIAAKGRACSEGTIITASSTKLMSIIFREICSQNLILQDLAPS